MFPAAIVTSRVVRYLRHRPRPACTLALYSGLEHRAVKALSDQQIADLRAGRGLGLALPAELT